jgi:ribonucleoside-diphosphate reductase alpha chain
MYQQPLITKKITHRDGTQEPFNADKINRSIERAAKGLTDPIAKVIQIATETNLTIYDGIKTSELDEATINAAVQNIKEDLEYDKIATRLLAKTIYKSAIGDFDEDNPADLKEKHIKYFPEYIKTAVAEGRLDTRMGDGRFDLSALALAMDLERDELFKYTGLNTVSNLYLLRDEVKKKYWETPQIYWMRIAMGLSYNEENPTLWAIRFYDKMSRMDYIPGTSTNIGAGTSRPSLSNCFLMEVHDDMAHIAKSVGDVMLFSKETGGLGVSLTKLRATNSPLKSNNGLSSGPAPFAKIMDVAIHATMRAGKRRGALCFYLENWHYDFPEFIDWKHNAGDDHIRMRTANTAAWISDEFMNRVKREDEWYMFDPAETRDLNELYGIEFSNRYNEYVEMAKRGEIRMFKKMPAKDLFRKMLVSLQTTSHPWITWKDPANVRALNNNTGTIHMSNLCTEILLPQDRDNIAVCNLASINLAAHVSNKEVNWQRLEESVRLAVRQLDNLIDINRLTVPEAIKADKENRAIGLGVMGLSDVLEQFGMSYDSPHAWDFTDRIFEFISYMAINESADLAQERGPYTHFKGSGWSKGMVPIDTIHKLERERGEELSVFKESKHKGLDWNILREKVKAGMRNATLMAVAPTATIGLVAGTVPGIDPRFAQVFSRSTLSGKYLDMNPNLVKDLKNLGLWETVGPKIIAHQGDISGIDEVPEHLKQVYKTSFTTSPYAYIEVAARAQKWVDQGLSRNMYLETRDIDDTMKVYMTAWEKGVKTTYYLHMKPRHTAEQSTVKVNKSEMTGKRGFGGLGGFSTVSTQMNFAKTEPVVAEAPKVEPVVEVPPPVTQPVLVSTPEPVVVKAPEPVSVVAEKPMSRGFGQVHTAPTMAAPAPEAPSKPKMTVHGPEDPQDALLCESCQ